MSVPRTTQSEITSSDGRHPDGKINSRMNERDDLSTW